MSFLQWLRDERILAFGQADIAHISQVLSLFLSARILAAPPVGQIMKRPGGSGERLGTIIVTGCSSLEELQCLSGWR